jgi:ribonuclease BN (tRNA processing enzyme)
MRLTVLGGCGAWPAAGQACSGYLIEHDGFRLVVDPGYATVPRLLALMPAERVDAVLISHGHPDHCADLNPLLRARVLRGGAPPALPVYTLPGAVDAVLALDAPGMLAGAYVLHDIIAGDGFDLGPFAVQTRLLPHYVPNIGVRLSAGGAALAYTGDAGPHPDTVALARDADLLLAEASYVDHVPDRAVGQLSTARQAAQQATEAGAARLALTHLWPGTDPAAAQRAAAAAFDRPIDVATDGLVIDLG